MQSGTYDIQHPLKARNAIAGEEQNTSKTTEILGMVVDIVSAYVRNNPFPASQVPKVISTVYSSLAAIEGTKDTANVTTVKTPTCKQEIDHAELSILPRRRQAA